MSARSIEGARKYRGGVAGLVSAVVAAAGTAGCTEPAGLMLMFTSELTIPDEVDKIRVQLWKQGGDAGDSFFDQSYNLGMADRMDITGAQWNLESAEAVLRLRAVRASGDWNEYWSYHRRRESMRNYQAAA